MKKILLIDNNYQPQSFINIRRALKHIYQEKVEVISSWEEDIYYGSNKIKYPSILKLKKPFKRQKNVVFAQFSRPALVKRDKSCCQYCGKKLSPRSVTIDHIIPKALGGVNSFNNCVVACHPCNNKKGHRTLEQSGMKLLKQPCTPHFVAFIYGTENINCWHKDWTDFIPEGSL